jgi:hypothetical protein
MAHINQKGVTRKRDPLKDTRRDLLYEEEIYEEEIYKKRSTKKRSHGKGWRRSPRHYIAQRVPSMFEGDVCYDENGEEVSCDDDEELFDDEE